MDVEDLSHDETFGFVELDDQDICYNCGGAGYQPDPELWPGVYICKACGDEWDIYNEEPEI